MFSLASLLSQPTPTLSSHLLSITSLNFPPIKLCSLSVSLTLSLLPLQVKLACYFLRAMSSRRGGRITEEEINELVSKLQSLLPETRRRGSGRVMPLSFSNIVGVNYMNSDSPSNIVGVDHMYSDSPIPIHHHKV